MLRCVPLFVLGLCVVLVGCVNTIQESVSVQKSIVLASDTTLSIPDTMEASVELRGIENEHGILDWFVDGVKLDNYHSDTLRYWLAATGEHTLMVRFSDTVELAVYEQIKLIAAGIEGTVLLTRGSALALVDCATQEYRIVALGPIRGSRFSPDGNRIVYWTDNTFHIVDIDGQHDTIALETTLAPWHVNWIDAFGFVWSNGEVYEPYVFCAQPFSGKIDTLFTGTQGAIISASISGDGTRLAWARPQPEWHVWTMDLPNNQERHVGIGCQGSVSLDGMFFTHNQSDHRHAFARNFADASVAFTIRSPQSEEFQFHRFSSQSNNHVVFQTDYTKNYVTDIRTDVKQYVGECVSGLPHDYTPRRLLREGSPPPLQLPRISPRSRRFQDSVVVAISIDTPDLPVFFSIDGSIPTPSSPRYEGPFVIKQSCEVRAIAISGGVQGSLANAFYLAPRTSNNSLIVIAPSGGERFSVGDTIPIRWRSPDSTANNVMIYISLDQGLTYHSITTEGSITNASPDWGNYRWVIPETIDGSGTLSHYCLIRVVEYGGRVEEESDAYFVIEAESGAR